MKVSAEVGMAALGTTVLKKEHVGLRCPSVRSPSLRVLFSQLRIECENELPNVKQPYTFLEAETGLWFWRFLGSLAPLIILI